MPAPDPCCRRALPPSSADHRRGQDVHDLQPALPGLAVQLGVEQIVLLLLQGRADHARQVAAVKATVELPLAAQSPHVGPGVAKAQDRVPAQPAHRVQAQFPHSFHESF